VLHEYLLFRAGSIEWPEERKSDVFLYYTQLLDARETIRLPRGWVSAARPDAVHVDHTYAAFDGSSDPTERGLSITSRAEVRRRQIPPDGYEGFADAMRAARDWGAAIFRVESAGRKEGGR
jgi:hypothetical protein